MFNQFNDEPSRDRAKAFLLMSNVEESEDGTGPAKKWIGGQPVEVKSSFTKLSAAMKTRFAKSDNQDLQAEAMDNLFSLKQRGRKLRDYFEEARDISQNLPESIQGEVAKRLVEGLDDSTTQRIVRGQLGKRSKKSLEETIQAIEGADEEDYQDEADKRKSATKFPHLKGSDLAIAKMLDEQKKEREAQAEELKQEWEASAQQMKMLIDGIAGLRVGSNNTPPITGPLTQPTNNFISTNRNTGVNGGYQNTRPPYASAMAGSRQPGGGSGYSTVVRQSGSRMGSICFRCCQPGHRLDECSNPEAPRADRERAKWEFDQRRREREAVVNDTTPSNLSNGVRFSPVTIPIDASQQRPQASAAAAVETYAIYEEGYQQPTIDNWENGDEEMYIHEGYSGEVNAVDIIQEWEDREAMAAQKRTARQAGFDPDPTPSSQWSQQQALQSTAPQARAPRAPPRPPRGLGDQQPFDIAAYLRNTTVPISIMQLAHDSPRVRARLADAVRLVENPGARARGKKTLSNKSRRVEVSSVEADVTKTYDSAAVTAGQQHQDPP